jgi:predicted site-specific integrase-resolvase
MTPLPGSIRDTAADHWFTPVEAARLCRVSLDTIRRRIRAGQIPGALRRGEAPFGEWALPRSGLEAAGLYVEAAPSRYVPTTSAAELTELHAEVARWKERAEAAERLVDELRSEIAFNRRVVERLTAPERMVA